MNDAGLEFYATAGPMTQLPEALRRAAIPADLNVISDMACINKVELLPWDHFGMMKGPHDPLSDDALAVLDDVTALVVTDDFDAIRRRYLADDRVRVPGEITSFINGEAVAVHLEI